MVIDTAALMESSYSPRWFLYYIFLHVVRSNPLAKHANIDFYCQIEGELKCPKIKDGQFSRTVDYYLF